MSLKKEGEVVNNGVGTAANETETTTTNETTVSTNDGIKATMGPWTGGLFGAFVGRRAKKRIAEAKKDKKEEPEAAKEDAA